MACRGKNPDKGILNQCGPRAECENRKKNGKNKQYGTICSYEVDTCLIKWKPRLLYVNPKFRSGQLNDPNCFACLDEALKSLKVNHGGYVIKLSPGIHRLNTNVEQTVDYLSIIGDTSPVKGVPFINGQRLSSDNIAIVPRYDTRIGKGPYSVSINSRTLTVSARCNPDFSSVCAGDQIGLLLQDPVTELGVITRYSVREARGNTITMDSDFGLNRPLIPGEGFFIYPNTTIETACSRKIFATERVEFTGILFNTTPMFVVGAFGGYTSLRNCVIEGYYFHHGWMNSSIPNIITGTFIWSFTGIGYAAFQGILGQNARVIFNGNPGAGFISSTISLTPVGMEALNSGNAHFDGSDFFRNQTAVRVTSGGSVHIPAARFIENIVALNGFYNSAASSEAGINLNPRDAEPYFYNNKLTMGAEWGTMFNVSNIRLVKLDGDPYVRLDGRFRENPEENPEDALGNAGSFIADKPNPYAGIE